MKKILLVFCFTASILGITSCQKDIVSLSQSDASLYGENYKDDAIVGDFEVKAGTIHFKDDKAYFKTITLIQEGKFDLSALNVFNSVRKINDKLLSEYEQLATSSATKKELDSWLKANKNHVYLEEESLQFVNNNQSESALLNSKYVVYIGKVLYKFTAKEQTLILDGDISKLGKRGENQSVKIVNRFAGIKSANLRPDGSCTMIYQKGQTSGNRRSTLSVLPSGSYVWNGVNYHFRLAGESKSKSERNWPVFGWLNDRTSQTMNSVYTISCYNLNNSWQSGSLNVNTQVNYDDSDKSTLSSYIQVNNVGINTMIVTFSFPNSGNHKLNSFSITNMMDC